MKLTLATIVLALISAPAFASPASKPVPKPIGLTVELQGEEAEKLMTKISNLPGAVYEVNTTVVTEIRFRNVDCTLMGSHGGSAAQIGETYSCSIQL